MKDAGDGAKPAGRTADFIPASVPIPTQLPRQWNTKDLGWRIGADVASALSAGVLIAPIISIIDRSIMENASGRRDNILHSVRVSISKALSEPHRLLFSKPPLLILLAYGGTFLTANLLDTATSTVKNKPATTVTHGTNKFLASSTANISLGIYKDQVYTRMFGPKGATPRPVPLPSYILFTLRDCMTIFASFNVPPLLAPYLNDRMSDKAKKYVKGQTVAQFLAPAAIQVASTPLHLLGLDLYNRPTEKGVPAWRERWTQVRQNWGVSVLARMCRIVPAFGVGGVVNLRTRQALMGRIVEKSA